MNELPFSHPDRVLLKVSDIRQWEAERDSLVKQMDQLRGQIEQINAKLQAAALLLGVPVAGSQPPAEAEEDDGAETMSAATIRILKGAGRALIHRQIIAELSKTPAFKARLDAGPNYYYTMMGRLVKRGSVVKVGKTYRVPDKE